MKGNAWFVFLATATLQCGVMVVAAWVLWINFTAEERVIVHANQEEQSLEAIAQRLGIHMTGRHTALGDALTTAQVFLAMIPLLEEKGLRTLKEVREAAQATEYAQIKY